MMKPDFPPLLSGKSVAARVDPFDKALAEVLTDEVTPGLIHYAENEGTLRAAITLAPEQRLADAIGVVFAVQLGLVDALGALGPPEVALHFTWPGGLKVNGASCGGFRAAADTMDPDSEPAWLIVGIDVPLAMQDQGGLTPDQTTLHNEGCVELTVPDILESWSRHMLNWIHTYLSEGFPPLHAAWRGRCDAIGTEITAPEIGPDTGPDTGLFVGLDERGGMLLRHGADTKLIPLTTILEVR